MMNRSVAVHVNMLLDVTLNLQSRNLLGDLVEAKGRNGTVRERKRNRRHDDAGKVEQRYQACDTASCPAGWNSKHHPVTGAQFSMLETTLREIMPAWTSFGKIVRGALRFQKAADPKPRQRCDRLYGGNREGMDFRAFPAASFGQASCRRNAAESRSALMTTTKVTTSNNSTVWY